MELRLGQRSVIWLIPYQNISYQVRTIEYVVKGEKLVNSYHEESEKVKMNELMKMHDGQTGACATTLIHYHASLDPGFIPP